MPSWPGVFQWGTFLNISLASFFTPGLTGSPHLSLSDNKSRQVTSTLLSIIAELNIAVVRIDSILLLISRFSSFFQAFGDL